MRERTRKHLGRRGALLAVASLVGTTPALAQHGGDGFLFKEPKVSFGIRMGYDMRRAGSDLFSFTRQQFTVGERDFDAPAFGGEIAFRTSDRVDLVIGLAHARSDAFSEYRDFIDADDLPIQQETELRTTPLTLSARLYTAPRGRSIGRFAWVPRRVTPYIGGGIGVLWYTFEQQGDFIDFATPNLDIFSDFLSTSGNAFTAHALAGLDVALSPYMVLNGEARLGWAEGEVAGSFVDFEKMDLAGLQMTVGLSVRF